MKRWKYEELQPNKRNRKKNFLRRKIKNLILIFAMHLSGIDKASQLITNNRSELDKLIFSDGWIELFNKNGILDWNVAHSAINSNDLNSKVLISILLSLYKFYDNIVINSNPYSKGDRYYKEMESNINFEIFVTLMCFISSFLNENDKEREIYFTKMLEYLSFIDVSYYNKKKRVKEFRLSIRTMEALVTEIKNNINILGEEREGELILRVVELASLMGRQYYHKKDIIEGVDWVEKLNSRDDFRPLFMQLGENLRKARYLSIPFSYFKKYYISPTNYDTTNNDDMKLGIYGIEFIRFIFGEERVNTLLKEVLREPVQFVDYKERLEEEKDKKKEKNKKQKKKLKIKL